MKAEQKRGVIENLAFAGALGAIALALVGAGVFVDYRRSEFERSSLSALAKRPIPRGAIATHDPDFARMYRVGGKGPVMLGAILSFRTARGAALSAALFAPDGELEAFRVIDASPAMLPKGSVDLVESLVGKGGRFEYPSAKDGNKAQAGSTEATEVIMAATRTLRRASAAARSSAEARP